MEYQHNHSLFACITTEEFLDRQNEFAYGKEMLRNLHNMRYCKAELFSDCMLGTILLPKKGSVGEQSLAFGFYLTEKTAYFIEEEEKLRTWLLAQEEVWQEAKTPEQLFLRILERITENDSLYFSRMESNLDQMEEQISMDENGTKDFFVSLMQSRKKLSELHSYYEQLLDLAEWFTSYKMEKSKQEQQEWNRFAHRVERLQNHVQLLRENALQIRELYQSMQDTKQNKIIGTITMVTSIFMPLTLITGWYGMNFSYMPELEWKYGYVAVRIVALATILLEILYFKKKKILNNYEKIFVSVRGRCKQ